MKTRTVVKAALGAALSIAAAAAQSLPAPPAGFKTLPQGSSFAAMKARGLADRVEAEKSSDWDCTSAPKINFSYGWQVAPGGDRVVELMAQAPQDPPSEAMGTRTEPAGKRRYKNGVLEWQKWTTTMVQTDCPTQLVTYHGKWAGYVSGKLIGVSVTHVKSKETGQAWIDEYVDKVVAAVAASR
jgi:hypothetical protein